MMKKAIPKYLLALVCLAMGTLLVPTHSVALPTLQCGEDSSLTVYGFLRNNAGMFLMKNPTFSQSGNQLATMRTWLRGYMDYKINPEFRIWSVVQFVHEPWYHIEDGNYGKGKAWASSSTQNKYTEDARSGGNEYSEYNDINQVMREMYVEYRPNPLNSFKIGRQIAIWGEAMTTRIGDVIQPDDTRFSFAFANLEDTRIPQWMLRAIHQIPSINSTFEWIVNPTLTGGKYSVNRSQKGTNLGSVPQRFGGEPERAFNPDGYGFPGSIINPAIPPGSSDARARLTNPTSRDWVYNPFAPGNHWTANYLPFIQTEYPQGWDSTRGGLRWTSLVSGTTFGFSYFHTQNYNPTLVREDIIVPKPTPAAPGYRQYTFRYPNIDIFGVFANHVFEARPGGVGTFEAVYIPNQVFASMAAGDPDGMTRRDYVKYMIGYTLNGWLYFPWHKDAPFDVSLEHVGEWCPANSHVQFITYNTEIKQWNPSFNGRVSTSWLYKLISTSLTVSYSPTANSGFIMPAVGWTPSWWNERLSFNLQYMKFYADGGDDQHSNDGAYFQTLRGKDMMILTTQLDW
jgi:hypothetical protein